MSSAHAVGGAIGFGAASADVLRGGFFVTIRRTSMQAARLIAWQYGKARTACEGEIGKVYCWVREWQE